VNELFDVMISLAVVEIRTLPMAQQGLAQLIRNPGDRCL
jgi:hypothetical protein